LENLTFERLFDSLKGCDFPTSFDNELCLNDWFIITQEKPESEISSTYHYKEDIYYKNDKVFTSSYSPFSNERRIKVLNNKKWDLLQQKIYDSHRSYIKKRLGSFIF
jgi:hypothetical protein